MTTVIATWFGDVCTPLMVGACSPFRCAVDGLSHINVDRDLERSAGRLSADGAFSSEVDTGLREENATNKKLEPPRF
jgi:hypothetical protein